MRFLCYDDGNRKRTGWEAVGRYRKYRSDQALRKAVKGYFDSISREKTVMEAYNTGQKDSWGHFVLEWRPVTSEQGVHMREREYVIPPTVGGLCAYLEISRDTWNRYCDKAENPQFAETCEWAREQLLAWREKELLRRPGKQLRGLIFDLQVNYGMSEKQPGSPPSRSEQEDDPITKSLKEAVRAIKQTNAGAGLALPGGAGPDL